MSLKRPENKMSKSDPDPKSRILITDSPEDIHAKLRGAITDSEVGISFDPVRRPGVSNLIEILRHVTRTRESSEYIAKDHANLTMRALKEHIAEEVIRELRGIRDRFLAITEGRGGMEFMREQVRRGGTVARRRALMTMTDVKEVMGITSRVYDEAAGSGAAAQRKTWHTASDGPDLPPVENPWWGEEESNDMKDLTDDGLVDYDPDDSVTGITLESVRRRSK
jgi:hypothetical protein